MCFYCAAQSIMCGSPRTGAYASPARGEPLLWEYTREIHLARRRHSHADRGSGSAVHAERRRGRGPAEFRGHRRGTDRLRAAGGGGPAQGPSGRGGRDRPGGADGGPDAGPPGRGPPDAHGDRHGLRQPGRHPHP
ncbi:hypothetical protein CQW39_01325 [Streptomyces griseofuscus]|uniref:Uncharacterized protein n=1 Tax=Streptomyces griseofuscus TaxID=146922 RepID=A0A426SBP5_9ACTN|nr:hypothetical protein CQW39_01325 [Streptomyces griseofuscus]RRQ87902.1 hypothetical protein CQW44_07770 [Streptomyces griseofuscus]